MCQIEKADQKQLQALIDTFDKSAELGNCQYVLACLYDEHYNKATRRLEEIDLCLDRLTIALEVLLNVLDLQYFVKF